MIETRTYTTRERALNSLLELDKDYTIIRHNFEKGEIIEPHKHNVNEWVIFDKGSCEVSLNLESKILSSKDYTYRIHFPKNQKHGLKCLTDISYWVVRENS